MLIFRSVNFLAAGMIWITQLWWLWCGFGISKYAQIHAVMHEYVHINQYGKAYYRIALHSIFPYGFTSTPLLTPDSSARKHRESLAFQEKTPSLMNICMTISCPFDHDAFLSVWEVHVPFCSRGLRLKNHLGWGVSTCFELSNVNKTGGDIHSSRLKPLSKASPVFFTALLQQPVFIQNQANLLQEKRKVDEERRVSYPQCWKLLLLMVQKSQCQSPGIVKHLVKVWE